MNITYLFIHVMISDPYFVPSVYVGAGELAAKRNLKIPD
jgi:hypothetical protein